MNCELVQRFLKHLSMQIVELGPGYLAGAYPVHVGPIERAPGVGESRPVDVLDSFDGAELFALRHHARAPVDDGSENIEGENFYAVRFEFHRRPHGAATIFLLSNKSPMRASGT